MTKKPDQRLAELGAIYKQRNAMYGDTYKNFGKVMKGFFPGPITLSTEEEWNRLALFFHCGDKLARYAGSFFRGGHVDSLDDNSVYSQLLQEYDDEIRNREPKPIKRGRGRPRGSKAKSNFSKSMAKGVGKLGKSSKRKWKQ